MDSEREKNIFRKFALASGVLAVFLFVTAWYTEETSDEKLNLQAIALRAESNLKNLESSSLHTADTVLSMKYKEQMMSFFSQVKPDSQVTFLVYENGKLLAWSGSDVTFVSIVDILNTKEKFIHLPNGWYNVITRTQGNRRAVIFISVYSDYSYQNRFLVNGFNSALRVPSGISLSDNHSTYSIHDFNGEALFTIRNTVSGSSSEEKFPFPELLETCAIVLLLVALLCYGRMLLYRSLAAAAAFAAAIIVARIVMHIFQFPGPLYQTALFSPEQYASSFFFNSPGALLFNVLCMLAVALIFFRHPKVIEWYATKRFSATAAVLHLFGISVLLILSFAAIRYYANGLILNSKISFDLSNILELTVFSILGFFILALLMTFGFIVFRFAADVIHHSALLPERNKRYTVFAFVLILYAVLNSVTDVLPDLDARDFIFLITLSVLVETLFIREKKLPVPYSVIFLVLFSLYTSLFVYEFDSKKQDENLEALARKLESRRDQVAEHLFQEINLKLKEDTILSNMLADKRNDLALLRLQQVYFSGYWSKYNIAVASMLDTVPDNAALTAEKLVHEKGDTTLSPGLFFIKDNPQNISYIARYLPSEWLAMYILFTEKFIQAEKGFPELYLSGDAGLDHDIDNVSFARYSNGALISSYGSYPYVSHFSFAQIKNEFEFRNRNLFRHLVYKPNASTVIVVSTPFVPEVFPFTTFSYIIAFFTLLILAVYGIIYLIRAPGPQHISLRQRVHASILLIVLVSFTIIGWTTVNYVSGRYDKDIDRRISEKITAIHHAMEAELPQQHMLADILSDEKTLLLTRIASNLSADFNLYDLDGRLIFSSQPRLYQQGIISDRMNPDAYVSMALKGRTQFVHVENIGGLNYIAAYEPVRNLSNQTEGYIGLPYFQKQEELKSELSSFIGSLMNLYMILLAAALGAAYFISSRITRPLLVLQEKFGTTRLGKQNEQIEWKRNDEIGNLVKQYNIMVDELEVSAELLARSERESAWREMAKQVAHEIKNPLTPMKLQVQLLQRAMEENSPRLNELTQKVSHMLMEQIDALTTIASSFSSFARMPQSRKEKVNLHEVVLSVITLYGNSPAVEILFNSQEKEYFVLADKEELLRVFGNLVRNAIQSIPEGEKGRVEIQITEKSNQYIVSVSDNGNGIPAELRSKIFTPNFTTKTGGMGLGLAIVKSIAESMGGKAWFETSEGAGTTFFVELPVSS